MGLVGKGVGSGCVKTALKGIVVLGLVALLAIAACRQQRPEPVVEGERRGPLQLGLAPL